MIFSLKVYFGRNSALHDFEKSLWMQYFAKNFNCTAEDIKQLILIRTLTSSFLTKDVPHGHVYFFMICASASLSILTSAISVAH